MIDIKVPAVGESISEVTLVKWIKNDGDYVDRDEVLAELESEKATFEVNAEKAGVLKTVGKEGDTLNIGDVLAQIDETAAKPEGKPQATSGKAQEENKPAISGQPAPEKKVVVEMPSQNTSSGDGGIKATPVASAIIADKKSRSKNYSAKRI
jgi:2-oxoglutarate dehydrogenase E2 component (dihydrolipoamide succinyltransferase)